MILCSTTLFRKGEIHVQFFDTPVTRAWVADTLVRPWADKVNPGQATDAKWEQGERATAV
jgi:hypothetical protein